MKTCSIEGCVSPGAIVKGMCPKHYRRVRLYGDPKATQRHETFEERMWSKVSKAGDCWLWTGTKRDGYGMIKREGVMAQAHRVSYEMTKGPIPEGAMLDHRCRNRSCVNPDHLRPVTNKQNQENKLATGPGKSGARGVHWFRGRWQGRVGHNGKLHFVGYFQDVEEAKAAVIAKRNELFTHNDADRMAS